MSTGFVWHERCMWHDPGPVSGVTPAAGAFQPGMFVENAETKRRLKNLLDAYDLTPQLQSLDAEPATDEMLLRFHTAPYLQSVAELSAGGGGDAGETALVGPGSDGIARLSAGGVYAAIGAVLTGEVSNAYSLCRPPGHHAERDQGRGFCLYNNIAVAILEAQAQQLVERVAVVDWDVHHGNGTQALVEDDPRVRYVSLHQWPLYPGTGLEEERGVGNVFNVPRPPGLPPAEYVHDLNEAVSQATDDWQPDLLIISAGFDAMAGDPLAGFTLEPEHYAEWTSNWLEIGAPIVSLLEGGYIPQRLAAGVVAHLTALNNAA